MRLTIKLSQTPDQPTKTDQETTVRTLKALGFSQVEISPGATGTILNLQGDIEVTSRPQEKAATGR